MNDKNNMLQLVNFEVAKELKKLGFDYICNYIHEEGLEGMRQSMPPANFNAYPYFPCHTSIPEIALVLQWLRQEMGIEVYLNISSYFPDKYEFRIYENKEQRIYIEGEQTYEEAETLALSHALKLLK